MEKLPRRTYTRPYMSHSSRKNKTLVFILIFTTFSEAYLTQMVKAQSENKKCKENNASDVIRCYTNPEI